MRPVDRPIVVVLILQAIPALFGLFITFMFVPCRLSDMYILPFFANDIVFKLQVVSINTIVSDANIVRGLLTVKSHWDNIDFWVWKSPEVGLVISP